MLAQATGVAATSIEPAVIVAFVVGVLAFVASGGLSWVFPSARAWRRIEQRAKVLEQVHDKISDDAKRALKEDLRAVILGQLSRAETAPRVAPEEPSGVRFAVQLLGLVVLSVLRRVSVHGEFAAQSRADS